METPPVGHSARPRNLVSWDGQDAAQPKHHHWLALALSFAPQALRQALSANQGESLCSAFRVLSFQITLAPKGQKFRLLAVAVLPLASHKDLAPPLLPAPAKHSPFPAPERFDLELT